MDDTRLPQPTPPAEACALKLLAGRAKSRVFLTQALERRGFTAQETAQAVERLAALGYLDDAVLARARATAMVREGAWGTLGMVERLVRQGIAPSLALSAVEAAVREEGGARGEAAARLLAKRGLCGARAARFLARRGFDEETIARLDLVPAEDYVARPDETPNVDAPFERRDVLPDDA